MLVVSSGAAFAAPLAGVGGFTIKADTLRGNNLVLYPGVSDSSEKEGLAVAVAEFSSVEIEGLKLYKQLNDLPVIGGNARIVITSTDTVTADTMLVKQYLLKAEKSTFNGLLIDEQPSSDLSKKFQQIAPSTEAQRHRGADTLTDPLSIDLSTQSNPGIVLKDATIKATYQAVNQINIPGLTLAVKYDSDGGGGFSSDYALGGGSSGGNGSAS
jgi:paraquat-inducible protein B